MTSLSQNVLTVRIGSVSLYRPVGTEVYVIINSEMNRQKMYMICDFQTAVIKHKCENISLMLEKEVFVYEKTTVSSYVECNGPASIFRHILFIIVLQ